MSWEMVAARVEIQFINRRLTDNENENIRDHAATVDKRADASVRSEWKLLKKKNTENASLFFFTRSAFPQTVVTLNKEPVN